MLFDLHLPKPVNAQAIGPINIKGNNRFDNNDRIDENLYYSYVREQNKTQSPCYTKLHQKYDKTQLFLFLGF